MGMSKTPYEKEADIEKEYDKKFEETLMTGLATGELTVMQFIKGVSDLKKEKDTKVLFEAGLMPKTAAPKAVGLSQSHPAHRQGVN